MNAALCRLIDRVSLEFAAMRTPRHDGRPARLEEARAFLESPDFAPPSAPARPYFHGTKVFRFDTPLPTAWANNNIVWGRFYRAGDDWRSRPAMLLLHGWNDAINHFVRFPMLARQLNRAGINAVTLTAPYHFRRWPKGQGAWGNFLCPDLLRTAQAVAQAVAENRAIAGWLLEQGCPALGLWGISLGGWLAALTAHFDKRFHSLALVVPAARLDRLLDEAAFCRTIRAALRGQRLESPKFNLTALPPPLDTGRILLVEGLYDLFVPPETLDELWEKWGHPEIWRLPCGHISVLGAPGLSGRIVRWVSERFG